MTVSSEIEERILANLDEAGEENAVALLNTICNRTGAAEEAAAFAIAVSELTKRGLVTVAGHETLMFGPSSIEHTLRLLDGLGRALIFRDRYWTDSRRTGPPFPDHLVYVIATPAGRQAGRELIERRGYDWWATRKP